MLQKGNTFIAGLVGLLLLLGTVQANEADDAIHRLTVQAREQARVGDMEGVVKTLDEVFKAIPDASPDSFSPTSELGQFLASRLGVELSQGVSPPATSEPGSSPLPPAQDPPVSQPAAPATPISPRPSVPPSKSALSPVLEPEGPPAHPDDPFPPQPATRGALSPPKLPSTQPAVPAVVPPAPAEAPQAPDIRLIDLLRRQGDIALGTGNVSGARRFYRRGAEAGCGACAEALAQTYDAEQLRRIGAVGIKPDPKQAEAWRSRARQLGLSIAPRQELHSKRPGDSEPRPRASRVVSPATLRSRPATAEGAEVGAPSPHPNGRRCRDTIMRVQLGEEPSDVDQRFLRNGCR